MDIAGRDSSLAEWYVGWLREHNDGPEADLVKAAADQIATQRASMTSGGTHAQTGSEDSTSYGSVAF